MSESHGTSLRLKRHEDLAKVAAYVKQQVREKSIEQVGEDLSEDGDLVGLHIDEEKNYIIWNDYGHHGNHLDGDEKNGIFINKREARHYFDLAGDVPQQYEEEWDDVDDPGEECPEEFCYILTGDAKTLDAVERLINDLCQQFGTPGNELGLYVPQQMLMKLLVGSDSIYYRGNVISMERQTSDRLLITTEADKGEPLLYALRECFENLTVEMKSEE